MADQRVVKYIQENLSKGHPEASLRVALLGAGYSSKEIDEAMAYVKSIHPRTHGPGKVRAAVLVVAVLAIITGVAFASGLFGCQESWSCTGWSPQQCPETGIQTRSCVDANSCGTADEKPSESRQCTPGFQACHESWQCGEWSFCSGGLQTRECRDANSCGTVDEKPETSRSCVPVDGGDYLFSEMDFSSAGFNSENVNQYMVKGSADSGFVDGYVSEVLDPDNSSDVLLKATVSRGNCMQGDFYDAYEFYTKVMGYKTMVVGTHGNNSARMLHTKIKHDVMIVEKSGWCLDMSFIPSRMDNAIAMADIFVLRVAPFG